MGGTRKIAAILVADIVGYSRLAGTDEDRTLSRLRGRSDLIDPAVDAHHGRVVKRTGDGSVIEFRSVVDAVRCAIEVQTGLVERNAGVPPERRIEFRVGIHLGDVVEEADGDLMGDGVNIAARLEGVAEPGAICLSEDAHRHVRDKLKHTFVDLGERELKNIARPMRVYALNLASENALTASSTAPKDKAGPPHLSIVVLPFTNMSGDPEQDYFVDGVTETLTTDLSRISGSFVIARNTAFAYKDRRIDVKQVGRELNVRYVLEGSVQRGGSRMRVNVQLIDAESGSHLWAERFDKPVADLFDMQDEIVSHLANALSAQLVDAEARRAERKPNPDSMDFAFRGGAWFNRGITPDNLAEARRMFERALVLDPSNVWGVICIALTDLAIALSFLADDDRAARFAAAEAAAIKALSLAPENAVAHLALGAAQISTNRPAQGIGQCERALQLDRNLAAAHAQIGNGKIQLGQAEEAEAHIQEALRLSPRDTYAYIWCFFSGSAKLRLGREEEAVAWLRRSIEANGSFPGSHFALAAALARLGRLPDASSEVQAGLAISPTFTIARFRAGASGNNNPAWIAGYEGIVDGLRKAGVPEQ